MFDRKIAVMLALAALPFSAPAQAAGPCTTTQTAFATVSNNYAATTSLSFEPMPGMRRLITTTARGCVIVDFSGELSSFSLTDMALLQVVIVGPGTLAEPGSVRSGRPVTTQDYELRAMRFVFSSLPAGSYNIRVEWRSQGGNEIHVSNRTMTLQYR